MAASLPRAPSDGDEAALARRATSYDVARAVGVAQSTVSRCFKPGSNVSATTRALVLGAAERLGYMPNALARSLITRRSDMVGVVATRYTLRGNPDVIYAIGEALAAAGKQLLLVVAESDAPGPHELRAALEYPLDGLISCVAMTETDIRTVRGRGIPVVLYNRRLPGLPVDSVTCDNANAAGEVAAALHVAGHRRFLFVGGPDRAPVSRERRDGFLARLRALGNEPAAVIDTDYSYEGGRDAMLGHIGGRAAVRPDAVFCASDQIALGVLDACRFELGLEVPRDISVVGFDDIAEAARLSYRLTTMHQDSVGMARRAVDILLRRLHAPALGVITEEVAARFVVRRSADLGTGKAGPEFRPAPATA